MLKENITAILEQIKGGNDKGEKIYLVGATKTVCAEIINDAVSCGLEIVAENKVQEFREKTDLIKGAKQHFIGHLQTNKVKYIVGKVELIHSVDSVHLGQAIDQTCAKKGVTQDILVEINIGGELSKSGFTPENAQDAVRTLSAFKNLRVKGLMAMLPPTDDDNLKKDLCLQMRAIYDKLKSSGYDFQYLSMGMSNDYLIAIQNGSNMIRVGSGIFGKRNYGV